MSEELLDIPAGRLLEKFGAGSHKPGSGSAAALQGMLAAQLIRTVVNLTCEDKRRERFAEWLGRLEEIDREIHQRIYPALERLVYEDSAQFDKVIRLRAQRDQANDLAQQRQLATQALEKLKPATEIPLAIAEHCAELAEFACTVFDHGFRAARGDSGLAMSSAASALEGCLAIVDLNLLSFGIGDNDWSAEISRRADTIRSRHVELAAAVAVRHEELRSEARSKGELFTEFNRICELAWKDGRYSNARIEMLARQLSIALWKHRKAAWRASPPETPQGVLKATTALRILGFELEFVDSLGEVPDGGALIEIAGLIDRDAGRVEISNRFPAEVRNFTAAHELGHALLHREDVVLHRDRARDGAASRSTRDPIENQADKFAACFLMPARLVRDAFQNRYAVAPFVIDARTSFEAGFSSVDAFRARIRDRRGLAVFLAGATTFGAGGVPFASLAQEFGVSREAMAIRLEELGLVSS